MLFLLLITTDQALERSRVDKKNLGGNAAKICLELIDKINEK